MESKLNATTIKLYEIRQNLTENLNNEQSLNSTRHLTRRYTCEPNISVKNFVPILRPISNSKHMIPSKFLLSSKRNNNNPLSCPVSEDENELEVDSDSSSNSSDLENSLNNEKKNRFNCVKKNLVKLRKNSRISNKSVENKKIDVDEKIKNIEQKPNPKKMKESDDTFEINKNSEFYRKHKYSCNILPHFYKGENLFNKIKRNRINSSSILEILENQSKIEE